MPGYSLLELATRLAADASEKLRYQHDPGAYLGTHGYGELTSDEVHTAMGHVADSVPPELAAAIDPDGGLGQLVGVDLPDLGIDELYGITAEPLPAELSLDLDDHPGLVDGFGGLGDDPDSLDAPQRGLDDGDADHDADDGDGALATDHHDTVADGPPGDAHGGLDGFDDVPTAIEHPGLDAVDTLDDGFDDIDELQQAATAFDSDMALQEAESSLQGADDAFSSLELEDELHTQLIEADLSASPVADGPDSLWEDFDV